MRLIFAGTPAFAAAALGALLAAGHEVVLVLTQPYRPAGRGMKTRLSEVKGLATEHGLRLSQPSSLKTPEIAEQLRGVGADAMVVAAYGLLIPPSVLNLFPRACINIHASLLPRWRGAAPIQRAILAGDVETGITIMQMDEGLDTGPMLLRERVPILPGDTAGSLHDRLARTGADNIVRALSLLQKGSLKAVPQPAQGAIYATKIAKNEATIDWSVDADAIERKVRAFNPVPVASTTWRGELLRVWRARTVRNQSALPGRAIDVGGGRLIVGCRVNAIELLEVQRAGGKRLPVAEFLRGQQVVVGEIFGS